MKSIAAMFLAALCGCSPMNDWLVRGEESIVCAKVAVPAHQVIGRYSCENGIWQRRAQQHPASYLIEVDSPSGCRLLSVSKAKYDRLAIGDRFVGEWYEQ
jgi:hypothetical protein